MVRNTSSEPTGDADAADRPVETDPTGRAVGADAPDPAFEPPLAIASLSGRSDADWAREALRYADLGAAFLGGIALDEAARDAARRMVDRGREEFLPADPVSFVDGELAALEDASLRPGVNVRSATVEPVREVARLCRERDALLEVNAHCRQAELCAVGCGETLLRDADRLANYVRAGASTGATVGVKVRAEVPDVDLPELAAAIEDAGAAFVHVDAMDAEPVVGDVADACDLFVIANNGVRDEATVGEYLAHGADAVSVGRPSDDPAVLERVSAALDRLHPERLDEVSSNP